jgi:serine phosphatase RsbU (regulator of sigma subunit)
MGAFLLHLLGLGAVAFWQWARPRYRRRTLFLLWWIGLILYRQVPVILSALSGAPRGSGPTGVLGAILAWIGSVLALRALLGLILWDRPRRRRELVWVILFAAGLLIGGLSRAGLPATALLGLPLLLSYRWVAGMDAGQLALMALSGVLSFVLSVVNIGSSPPAASVLAGALRALPEEATILVAIYSLFSLPASTGRIHLSIRRIWVRLVGSHLLTGLIPLSLVMLFLFLSGAFFLSEYRGALGARLLAGASADATREITRSLAETGRIPAEPFGPRVGGQIILARLEAKPIEVIGERPAFSPDTLLACDIPAARAPLLWDRRAVYLRARLDTLHQGLPLRIEALAPIDSLSMVRISRLVGAPVRVHPATLVARSEHGGVSISIGDADEPTATTPGTRANPSSAVGPESRGPWNLQWGSTLTCLRGSSSGWVAEDIFVSSSARIGEEFGTILHGARGGSTGVVVFVALLVIAALFLGAIWVTGVKVLEMGRSITQAVRALTDGTAALSRGQLDYRIPIEGEDELWGVAGSFNGMAEGLERMRTLELERERMDEELRLAREIQQRLLPSGPPTIPGLELAGLSLPAREVGGDYFDFFALEDGRVGLAIADVSGKGTPAALLMSAFRASLRSQDLGQMGPAEVLSRVNRFIHSSVDPGRFVTAFLAVIDPATGELRYSNAGHDAPLLVETDGAIRPLTEGGLLLGLLPQAHYPEATCTVAPGALLIAYTDGITEAQDAAGEFFGSERLESTLRACTSRSCQQVLDCIVREVRAFSPPGSQHDDITLILARRL